MTYIKSPIFYMGNKYKLLGQVFKHIPEKVDTFYDVFGGSAVVSLNVSAQRVYYNELNPNIFNLVKLFVDLEPREIIGHVTSRIEQFGLLRGAKNKDTQEYKRCAQEKYIAFRDFYNLQTNKNYLDLYTLTYYSFSNLIRFNKSNGFNMPVGNQMFNEKTHAEKIRKACERFKELDIRMSNQDANEFLSGQIFKPSDFVYLDPPYLNTTAIYNESRAYGGWKIEDDCLLFDNLDKLNDKGIKWALSNVAKHKGKINAHLLEWAEKYHIHYLEREYSALGKGNAQSSEVLITNYQSEFEHDVQLKLKLKE